MISPANAIDYVLSWEGGLEENASDPGGISNMGISLRFLKSLKPDSLKSYGISSDPNEDDILNLTYPQVSNIYLNEFWKNAPFDKINNQDIVNYLFDFAVNAGIANSIKCIQRAIWSVMKKIDEPVADGILGPTTIDLINHCAFYLLPPLRAERGAYYRSLVEKNPNLQQFLSGWNNRTFNVKK